MKKSILILAILACTVSWAQDTIHCNGPLPNYYDNGSWFYEDTLLDWIPSYPVAQMSDWASCFYTEDSLTVYGVAAILVPKGVSRSTTNYAALLQDMDSVYEYFRLYTYGNRTLTQHPEQMYVNLKLTPISYYLKLSQPGIGVMGIGFPDTIPALPVYERYLQTPVTMGDTFFVGRSNIYYRTDASGNSTELAVGHFAFNRYPDESHKLYTTALGLEEGKVWQFRQRERLQYIFPILTPDTNTTAIGENRLLDRLTGVMPNPAVGTAKVVSSFGMSMVEAYDMSGTLVHRQKADVLATTLDVRHWPTGTYLLRIHTPQGTATKKLVVRR